MDVRSSRGKRKGKKSAKKKAVKSGKYPKNDHSKRLPAELLSEIFILCQPTDRSIWRFNRIPFMLGHVCQQWRHVAFQLTPRLWTHLNLASPNCGNADDMSLLSQWVARACPYKVTISIRFYYASSHLRRFKSTPLDDIPLPKVLLPSRLQGVENMDLELPIRSFKQLATEPRWEMPDLKALTLEIHNQGTRSGRDILVGCKSIDWSGCPQLREVTIRNPISGPSEEIPSLIHSGLVSSIRWAQITRLVLHVRHNDLRTTVSILLQARQLVICSLVISWFGRGNVDVLAAPSHIPFVTTHPNLESLKIDVEHGPSLPPILQRLLLPSLKELDIRSAYARDDNQTALLDLKQRSQFSLMSVSLHGFPFDVHQFLEFLDSPTLQNITLRYCAALNEDMISALSKSPSAGNILPCLKRLSITDGTILVEDEIVLNMIESRISQLETVKIEGGYPEPDDLEDRSTPRRASSKTFRRAQALKDGGLILDYLRLTEKYWDSVDEDDFYW